MFGAATKACSLSSAVKATTYLTPNVARSVLPSVTSISQTKVNAELPEQCNYRQSRNLLQPCIQSTLSGTLQLRYAHTDHLETPNFDAFRKSSAQNMAQSPHAADDAMKRRQFAYLMALGGSVQAAIIVKNIIYSLGESVSMSKDVLAMSKTEILLDAIPEGKTVVMTWRSKPMFVRHRTSEEIEKERAVNLAELRDPQHDADRCIRPEWLIVIGVCTHLGCVPISNAGAFGGFFCPCHGSHYDTSGRIRKGPAPLNLEVPPQIFPSDNLCIVG